MKPETMRRLLLAGKMHGAVPNARYAWAVLSDPAGSFVLRMQKAQKHLPIADVVLPSPGAKLPNGTFPVLIKAERGVSPADAALIEDEILAIYEKLRMDFNPLVLSRLRLAAVARGLRGFPTDAAVRVIRRVDAAMLMQVLAEEN